MKKLILLLVVLALAVVAEQGEADSLRSELEEITARLEKIEREKLEKRKAELEAELQARQAMEPKKDTIVVVDTIVVDKDEEYEEVRTEEVLMEIKKRLSSFGSKGFGGSGGPNFGLGVFNVRPVKDMIATDIARRGPESPYYGKGYNSKIEGDYENFFMMGGMGIAGIGNGIRIGGAGYGGSRTYRSDFVDGTDSLSELEVSIGYGGILLEKAWYGKRSTISVGTLLGAGGISTSLTSYEFGGIDWSDASDYYKDISTAFFAGDLHAGVTLTLTSWLHVGVDAFTMLMASTNGFDYNDGFATFNGGGRIRILFGNLG